nr:13975_t:CDS:2 [Entrophospora candida]
MILCHVSNIVFIPIIFNIRPNLNNYNIDRSYSSSSSSKRWLARRDRDKFIKKALSENYRARSVFKLIDMDKKYKLVKPNSVIIDCGASPGDFTTFETQNKIIKMLGDRKVDVVLSDMSPNSSGQHFIDHVRSMELCESTLIFAEQVLKSDGTLLCKFLMGGDEKEFREKLKSKFKKVIHERPLASRKESTELYYVCLKYIH